MRFPARDKEAKPGISPPYRSASPAHSKQVTSKGIASSTLEGGQEAHPGVLRAWVENGHLLASPLDIMGSTHGTLPQDRTEGSSGHRGGVKQTDENPSKGDDWRQN